MTELKSALSDQYYSDKLWQDKQLWDPEIGSLYLLFKNYIPIQKNLKSGVEKINKIDVLAIGLLLCEGKKKEKADYLYEML